MSRTRMSPLTLWLTIIVAVILAILPLPEVVATFRPPWVTMVIIYWCMMWPRLCGILTAFIAGLLLDVLFGNLLGEHALSLSVVAYLTQRFHLQIRLFPFWQLTATAFLLMAVDAFLGFWVDGMAGFTGHHLERWVQVATGGLVWAPVMALLDTIRLRAENRSQRFF